MPSPVYLQKLRQQVQELANAQELTAETHGLLDTEYLSSVWQKVYDVMRKHQVIISAMRAEGANEHTPHEESVTITNTGAVIANLSGWRLNAGTDQDYIFPENTRLLPGEALVVWTFDQDQPYSFCSHNAVWNNRGDTALLFNNDGEQVSALCYGSDAAPSVAITEIQYDGIEGREEADEYAEIQNYGDIPADISGWTLSAGKNQDFVFPEDTILMPSGCVRVYTNKVVPETGGFSFESNTAIWNNKEDCGRLYDYRQELVNELHYKDGVAI